MKKNNNKLLILIIVAIISIIIVIGAMMFFNTEKPQPIIEQEEEKIDTEALELQFDNMFNNEENEYVISQAFIQDEKAGAYYMDAHIPKVTLSGNVAEQINNEINQIFINKLMQVGNESTVYTIFKMEFCTKVNNNILSLAIKCVLKEGGNPQRTIIKTYNYNLEDEKLVDITEIIPEAKKDGIQKEINKKIQTEIKREETIIAQGYNVFRRNSESEIYLLENSTEFYIQDNILYIIYCYGNNSYTSETDLIITSIK